MIVTGPDATGGAASTFAGWSAEDFLKRPFPLKEPLITNLVHRRDLIALGARRRHGKTSFTTDMGVALAVSNLISWDMRYSSLGAPFY